MVVDASVLLFALIGGDDAAATRQHLANERLEAPELIDLEIVSALRREVRLGRIESGRAEQALQDLNDLRIHRAPHLPLLERCWQLRANLTPYDAAYVALAEALDDRLVTADQQLARASGPRCPIEVLRT